MQRREDESNSCCPREDRWIFIFLWRIELELAHLGSSFREKESFAESAWNETKIILYPLRLLLFLKKTKKAENLRKALSVAVKAYCPVSKGLFTEIWQIWHLLLNLMTDNSLSSTPQTIWINRYFLHPHLRKSMRITSCSFAFHHSNVFM